MKILLATPFDGREAVFPRWLAAFEALDLAGHEVRVLWLDTRPGSALSAQLTAWVEAAAAAGRYAQVRYRALAQTDAVRQQARNRNIAGAFRALAECRRPGETLVVLESDILGQPDAVQRLLAGLEKRPRVAMLAAAQYWRGRSDAILVWRLGTKGPTDLVEQRHKDERVTGLEAVGATATGLSAFAAWWLDGGYAFRWSGNSGHDICASLDARADGYECCVDWGIKVRHLDNDGVRVWESELCRLAWEPGTATAVVTRERVPMAVAVTCHPAYVRWLAECLAAIEAQDVAPTRRLLYLDRVPASEVADPAGWETVRGDWASPVPPRNLAARTCGTPWLVHWDADNVMPEQYVRGMSDLAGDGGAAAGTGILYPDIQECDEGLRPQALRTWPDFDYWKLRHANCIDTAAAWRVDAIRQAGGWEEAAGLDDYSLALRVTAAGWAARRAAGVPPVLYRLHGQGRGRGAALPASWLAWGGYTWTVLVLLAGRRHLLPRTAELLARLPVGPRTDLVLVDNSGSNAFAQDVACTAANLAGACRYRSVRIVHDGAAYVAQPGEAYMEPARHRHVADLYSRHLLSLGTDYVLTVEDDVFPADPRHVERLAGLVAPYAGVQCGAAAATYRDPAMPDHACGARGPVTWDGFLRLDEVQDVEQVGFVPGGCTAWRGAALAAVPGPLVVHPDDNGKTWGWDGLLCRRVREAGYSVVLCGAVRAEHVVHGGPAA